MEKEKIRIAIEKKTALLGDYREYEKAIIAGRVVKSYGLGSRNLTRETLTLSEVRKIIKELESEIAQLEAKLNGARGRRIATFFYNDRA